MPWWGWIVCIAMGSVVGPILGLVLGTLIQRDRLDAWHDE